MTPTHHVNDPLAGERLHYAIMRAVESGQLEHRGGGAFTIHRSGDCESPIIRHRVMQRQHILGIAWPFIDNRPADEIWKPKFDPQYETAQFQGEYFFPAYSVEFLLRCRECIKCRHWRRRLWTARAIAEIEGSVRTWFVTLTLRPSIVTKFVSEFASELSEQHKLERESLAGAGGTEFDVRALRERQEAEFARETMFDAVDQKSGRLVTLFLKRLRKNFGALRYLCVCEKHESGVPHFHLLIHENAVAFKGVDLRTTWQSGFVHCKLVENSGASGYVCKYLTKASVGRLRASRSYGKNVAKPKTISARPQQELERGDTKEVEHGTILPPIPFAELS